MSPHSGVSGLFWKIYFWYLTRPISPFLYLQPEEPAAAPIVPPKLRPALPPKQMIDKSREDLAQIDLKFKSSLVELRSRSAGKNQFHDS